VSDKRMLWVVLAGISLCLKVCVLVNKSSRSSHSSYSSSSSYDPYGLNAYKGSKSYPSFQGSQRSQELRAFEDALSQERALKTTFESDVRRNCSFERSGLRVEVDFTDPGMASLMREVNRSSLPTGTWLPPPLVTQGLGVTLKDGKGEKSRLCLDADETLLQDVLARVRPSAELVTLGAGAWSMKTSDGTGTMALVSPAVLDTMTVKGPLVAFAPTDDLVVFADSANAAAITRAAKYAAEHTATNGDDGCVAVEPLVRTNGSWGTWLPNGKPSSLREVEQVRVAARECLANLAVDSLQSLVILREMGMSGVAFVETFDASERTFAAKQSTVTLALDDSSVPQVLSPAQFVKLATEDGRELSMSWGTFVAIGGTRLTPVAVKGTPVPNTFFFSGGLSAADFTGKKGVKSQKR